MRIIDKSGRLFGKFNIFDITIILFVILLLTVIYVKITREGKLPPARITDVCKKKEVIVEVVMDHPWVADYASPGDSEELDEGEYLRLLAIEERKIKSSANSRQTIAKFQIIAKINYSGALSIGRRILYPGEQVTFYGPGYILSGVIYKVYDTISEK